MTVVIEKEAGDAWNRLRGEIDELNSKGTEPPVYRAALSLPLTQGGITAVVGSIAEYPSGFTFYLLNTGGAGETFLICAIDGVWRVWQETDGFIPLVSPAVAGNLVELTAGGALVDAGFAVSATGEDLVTAADVDGARGVLDLPPQFNQPRYFDWQSGVWQSVDVIGSGSGSIATNVYHSLATGATANSRIRRNINTNIFMLNRSSTGINWSKRLDVSLQMRANALNAEGVFRVIIGKTAADAFGLPASGNYIAVTVENTTITTGHVCRAGVLTAVALTASATTSDFALHITSNNGTVSWYYNGILIGTTTAGPTANAVGTLNLEIENGATPANYAMRLVGESWGY